MKYDLVVIGGGPAGYVGAIRAAQLGKKVACVEMERAGGTCLNWGCIPTKSLLRNAELYHLLSHKAGEFGFSFDNLSFDWSKVIGRSRTIANRLAGGIEFLFKKNGIDYIVGKGNLLGDGKIEVEGADGKSVIEAANVLVATGVVSREFPGFPFDGDKVIGSREALALETQPKDIVIIGAGAIGVEFAYFFNAFGTKVTLIEMLPNILPVEDEEVGATLEKSFSKSGIKVLSGTKTTGTKVTGSGVEITVEGKENTTVAAEKCLVAIGVKPLLPGGQEPELTDRGDIAVACARGEL
jgi:dihydrolipoamide dehydrogenase